MTPDPDLQARFDALMASHFAQTEARVKAENERDQLRAALEMVGADIEAGRDRGKGLPLATRSVVFHALRGTTP